MKKFMLTICTVISMLVMTVLSAFAVNTGPSAPFFDAYDITGLSGNTSTILLAGVGLLVLFTGYRFLKKAGNKL